MISSPLFHARPLAILACQRRSLTLSAVQTGEPATLRKGQRLRFGLDARYFYTAGRYQFCSVADQPGEGAATLQMRLLRRRFVNSFSKQSARNQRARLGSHRQVTVRKARTPRCVAAEPTFVRKIADSRGPVRPHNCCRHNSKPVFIREKVFFFSFRGLA